jgi:hypothetical protein
MRIISKAILFCFIQLLLFRILLNNCFAINNPLKTTNNNYGIHIIDTLDLEDAAKLVNSSGGDWGYVTFVIRKDERDTKRWQEVFNKVRKLHLIPIVRIATRFENKSWEKPNIDEIDGWVSFLGSLNWVIQNRYVVLGNEPNHAAEWGGSVNPYEYANYLSTFSKRLKEKSEDFFILPAGLDASAPNSKTSMEESIFIRKMVESNPEVFTYIDGWASHSYPNPGFSGSENGFGKGTIRTYDWELNFLKTLGINKELPVFITETGWVHELDKENKVNTSIEKISQKLEYSFKNVWNDKRIVAVTPFVLSYYEPPFDVFSWKNKNGNYYDIYNKIQSIPKIKGEPIQITKGKIEMAFVPPLVRFKKDFKGFVVAKNIGQSIWEPGTVVANLFSPNDDLILENTQNKNIEPYQSGILNFDVKNNHPVGFNILAVSLFSKNKNISNEIYLPQIILP